jgi:hypothetical protein
LTPAAGAVGETEVIDNDDREHGDSGERGDGGGKATELEAGRPSWPQHGDAALRDADEDR